MLPYNRTPVTHHDGNGKPIASFMDGTDENFDAATVASFGEEWEKFGSFSDTEIQNAGDQYFDIVSPEMLNEKHRVLDLGCGTGRWTKYVADRAGFVEAVDPSKAVFSAVRLLEKKTNVRVSQAGVDNIPFADESFDFVFSLGVLHHIPDTRAALHKLVQKLKPGGYCLIYLYYSLDNRGPLFKALFAASNLLRRFISGLPSGAKKLVCDLLAIVVYFPLVTMARFAKAISPRSRFFTKIPLSYYHDKSWNIIRNDALDRFGTPLEQRFSKAQIREMMLSCGLQEPVFSSGAPFWHAVGRKG